MPYRPVLPIGGPAGWAFLQRTQDSQRAAHAGAPDIQRERAYFRDKIGGVTSLRDMILLLLPLAIFPLDMM